MCLPVNPYKIEREWEHCGLKCAVVLAREAGHRCGYVRVPPKHSLHGKSYEEPNVEVHGGLTFGEEEPCIEEDGKGWWFGFDFAHAWDASYDPCVNLDEVSEDTRRILEIVNRHPAIDEHYWTQAEAERETESLAQQLAAII